VSLENAQYCSNTSHRREPANLRENDGLKKLLFQRVAMPPSMPSCRRSVAELVLFVAMPNPRLEQCDPRALGGAAAQKAWNGAALIFATGHQPSCVFETVARISPAALFREREKARMRAGSNLVPPQ